MALFEQEYGVIPGKLFYVAVESPISTILPCVFLKTILLVMGIKNLTAQKKFKSMCSLNLFKSLEMNITGSDLAAQNIKVSIGPKYFSAFFKSLST